jgi:hypothetical protein
MPVFPCIRPYIKTPVVGGAKLWKNPIKVITGGAAAQQESECEHLGGQGASSPAETGSRRSRWKLAILGALASPTFVMTIVAYIQFRPNTRGVAITSPFDSERAFAGSEAPGRLRSQTLGFASSGACPRIHHR